MKPIRCDRDYYERMAGALQRASAHYSVRARHYMEHGHWAQAWLWQSGSRRASAHARRYLTKAIRAPTIV